MFSFSNSRTIVRVKHVKTRCLFSAKVAIYNVHHIKITSFNSPFAQHLCIFYTTPTHLSHNIKVLIVQYQRAIGSALTCFYFNFPSAVLMRFIASLMLASSVA